MTDEDSLDDVWASPTQVVPSDARPKTPKTPGTPKTPSADRQPEPVDRDAALQRELEGVRGINKSIEAVLATLSRSGDNMEVVSKTVSNASSLLNTWTRILSQTEHNQRLILHPSWKGATEDLVEQETEALEKQRQAERKAAEEEQKLQELRRRREEDEDKRRLGVSSSSRGVRGSSRTRGTTGRGAAGTRGGTSSTYRSDTTRPGTQSGRGPLSSRGRASSSGRGRSRPTR
ncbi:hypothetical protein CDD80_2714 [Ophiocordyceps camponoti-rufipedis]|uniref:DASH complex subunit DUO1 n=1 Tax=Ophiocordyceps camponoti-rufipedis TaxID=2004952 RepID=A0A2C5Z741_9HYPO|nr:hypothetical protein CDD80_2714 [Ophiocordyceps camponoti-rufipedis]